MTHCLPNPRPRIRVQWCKLTASWEAVILGVTHQPGWASGSRDCPLEAVAVALHNALIWLDIDRAKAVLK